MRVEGVLLGALPLLLLVRILRIRMGILFPFRLRRWLPPWRFPYPRQYGCEMVAFYHGRDAHHCWVFFSVSGV